MGAADGEYEAVRMYRCEAMMAVSDVSCDDVCIAYFVH
jgi:hypothetical protein